MELDERLSDAALRGDTVTLTQLLSQYPNLLERNYPLDERLSDAALRGSTLTQLLSEDPNLLERNYLKCEDKNVLHVAAMLGNEEFFQAVLQANSSFCHDMCLARDRNGKNPIHLAASHGKLNILNLINDYDWLVQAALEKADNGGTILHLCVKHNQLDALRLLLRIFTDPAFQKTKNEDGMTILHLAFSYNQNQRRREVIMYLIKNVAKIVNLKNADGKTALDLFFIENRNGLRPYFSRGKPTEQYDKEMLHSLYKANLLRGRHITKSKIGSEWFEKRRDAIMVVASLIATMAFQAMIRPPGGTWQDDLLEGDNPHRVGESVMARTHPNYYKHLIRANTVAFVSSLSTIILLVRGMGIRLSLFHTLTSTVMCLSVDLFHTLTSTVMWLSVASIAVVYSISLVAIVPKSVRSLNMNELNLIAIVLSMVCVRARDLLAEFVESMLEHHF